MPKSQFIDPKEIRAKGKIVFEDIPVNQYDKTFAESAKDFTNEELLNMYHDMHVNREMENMISGVRKNKHYNGVDYAYVGPAHLSIGMEAEAVGMAYGMELDDWMIGAHRAHGEVLCKGLMSIRRLPDEQLYKIMNEFFDGALLRVVEKYNKTGNVKDLATDFLFYGFICEVFGRENGFTKGLGSSMHAFFTPFGIYPNNAIVGGAAGLSTGLGLFKKISRAPGMVVCAVGDGSTGCGPVLEALNYAAQAQFTKLWEEPYKGGLPILFNFVNNQYGMGGQTADETMAWGMLARLGAGFSPTQFYAERIDGYNPFAVIDAFKRKRELVVSGKGPVLLDTVTYRYCGHSTTDANTYRTKEEIDAWEAEDSILAFKKGLAETGIASNAQADDIEAAVRERITKIMKLAIDEELSPRVNLVKNPNAIRELMFSNGRQLKMDDREPDVLTKKEENSRYQKLAQKSRFGLDSEGKPISKLKVYSLRDAIFEAIFDKYYEDPTLITMGEDVREWGGSFGVTNGMYESIPIHRLFNTPISEGTIVASAVGYALCGGRAVPELMYCDFLGRAADEVFNQMAKWQAMSGGILKVPVVLRLSCGSKYGAQHAQDWTSLCTHMPGLKVVFPVTPYDAKGLMNAALAGTDPVIFFESQRLYDIGEQFHEGGVPEGYYEIPLGEPDIKRPGSDITILSIGAALYTAINAAERLQDEFGLSAEVIDARSLVPFNYELLLESVKKTGRLVIISDACERGAYSNDIARNVTEMAFDYLDAPPVVVCAPNVIAPFSDMEKFYYPQPSWILDAINEKILPLQGYTSGMNFTTLEHIRREKMGI